ncbi:MAG: MoaD/ThiS family protein [Desulfomonilaceae bacterium]|nr:MoaD/ThiS family protein [Desulfomonilaceae bacterium]
MKVELILYASLVGHMPPGTSGNSCTMEVEEGSTVGDLMKRLGLPERAAKVIFLNGRHAKEEHSVKEGDRIAFFPPVAGG